jgi:hypothetical protein
MFNALDLGYASHKPQAMNHQFRTPVAQSFFYLGGLVLNKEASKRTPHSRIILMKVQHSLVQYPDWLAGWRVRPESFGPHGLRLASLLHPSFN